MGKKIGRYTITENVQAGFELVEKMTEAEKNTFFGLIILKSQIEAKKIEDEIFEKIKTNLFGNIN